MRTEYYSSFDEACDRADANRGRLRIVADGAKAPDRPREFRLVPFGQLSPGTSSSYRVKGLIPRVGIVAVWGPPKCGKSFWAFDLAMHSALGWEYRGRRVISGTVVYCAFEGAEGFKARAAAFRQHHNIAPDAEVPFLLMPTRLDLVKDHAALIASIQGQSEAPFWWCSTPSTAACVDLNQATRT